MQQFETVLSVLDSVALEARISHAAACSLCSKLNFSRIFLSFIQLPETLSCVKEKELQSFLEKKYSDLQLQIPSNSLPPFSNRQ